MRRFTIVLLLAAAPGCFLSLAQGAESAGKADAARIARLIEQLGSERFSEREAAVGTLDQIGPAALDQLRKAVDGKDLEIARRAQDLVGRLERRVETARALEAPRLRLVYKDTPLPEAIADFAKKTGCPVQLEEKEKEPATATAAARPSSGTSNPEPATKPAPRPMQFDDDDLDIPDFLK